MFPCSDFWEKADIFTLLHSEAFDRLGGASAAAFTRSLSGFTGSSARLFLTPSRRILCVDGRYTLQARAECPAWEVVEVSSHHPSAPCFQDWCNQQGFVNARIAMDPAFVTVSEAQAWRRLWPESLFVSIPLRSLWGTADFPFLEDDFTYTVSSYPISYAGKSSEEKRQDVLKALSSDCAGLLLASPESIAWLLNVRAESWPAAQCSPTFPSLAFVSAAKTLVFVPQGTDVKSVQEPSIEWVETSFKDRDAVVAEKLASLRLEHVAFVPSQTPQSLWEALTPKGLLPTPLQDPLALPRCLKNPTELKNARQVHQFESRALKRLLSWIEATTEPIIEDDIAQKLEEIRRENPSYKGPSFASIIAFGANSAVVHYTPKPQSSSLLGRPGPLLLDVGGHYLGGTTDMTRTLWLGPGTPPADFKRAYTNVLKGHIALARAIFPRGTTGGQLDALARQFLWQDGLDYHHGTGHGVGSYLAVHEGPCGISPRNTMPLQEGMVVSIEPGVYLEGKWGIRLENLYEVVQKSPSFLSFKPLTQVPFDRACLEAERLTEDEWAWIRFFEG